MAVVWRAYDPALDREVAIKEPVLPHGADERLRREFEERFVREAKTAARLNHPSIVTVHTAGVFDGRPGMVMELVEGQLLSHVIRRGRPPLALSESVIEQLLSAVGYAHQRGVIHRDLKPDNIFITPGGAIKLADFGVAHLKTDSTLTTAGTMLGTPAYMSPEQVRGVAVDERSDLFSIGVIAYALLTGSNPFSDSAADTGIATILYRITQEMPAPLEQVAPALPRHLAATVSRALEKSPADRFPDAEAMRAGWTNTVITGPARPVSVDYAPPQVGHPVPDHTILESSEDSSAVAEKTVLDSGLVAAEPTVFEPAAENLRPRAEDTLPRERPTQSTHIMPEPDTREAPGDAVPPARKRNRVAIAALLAVTLSIGGFLGVRSCTARPEGPAVASESDPAAPTITIPDVSGMKWDEASRVIEAVGLVPTATAEGGAGLEPAPAYLVLSQEPAAASPTEAGAQVVLVLDGPQSVKASVRVSDKSITRGDSIKVSAALLGADGQRPSGQTVTLQYSLNKRTWTRIGSGRTTSGTYTRSWKPGKADTYYVRAVFAGTRYWVKATSAATSVKVSNPAPAKRRAVARPRTPSYSTGFE